MKAIYLVTSLKVWEGDIIFDWSEFAIVCHHTCKMWQHSDII